MSKYYLIKTEDDIVTIAGKVMIADFKDSAELTKEELEQFMYQTGCHETDSLNEKIRKVLNND